MAAALALGIPGDAIARGILGVEAVPGRFERVDDGEPFRVLVDYAHTDDALTNLLSAVRELGPLRVITVFGCGGDRDRAKRPKMGFAAASGSDVVVVTSDNPRSESPMAIIEEILPGVWRALTGDPRGALPAAAAIELLHNFTLIHDDIEDQDPARHHRPTVWSVWGVPQAINAGDGMFAVSRLAVLQAFDTPQWIAALYLGVACGALAFILWVLALQRASPTRVANTMTVNPIAAGLLATQLVGEPITLNLVIGLIAVFAGIWIATTE